MEEGSGAEGEEMDYDVFISHGADDKATAETVATRLRAEGIKVTRLKGNLMRSRVLLIVVTASVYGEEASAIGRQIDRFQKTRNPQREIVCLCVENASVWDGIEQLPAINWVSAAPNSHRELLNACRKATITPTDSDDPPA
jgi:hypothetical protein